METGEILACAAGLLGTELTPEQETRLAGCCVSAQARCQALLREEACEEQAALVLQACGLLAAGLYLDMERPGGEISSFTAGKLSVTTAGGTGGRAGRMKDAAMELLAPLCRPDGAFLGVRG